MPAKIFVGNLNYQTTQANLTKMLAEAGDIVDVYMPNDRATGRPRGFAFVEFASPEQAANAIETFNGKELDGRALKINEAEERRRAPSQSSGESYGGFGSGGDSGFAKPAKPKGSRRNLRRKKRSL